MNRRGFIGGALALLAGATAGLKAKLAKAASRIRPPGAKLGDFERRCIRCFRCAEVCPPKAIRFHSGLDFFSADLPFLELDARGCILCMKCTEVCPTSALEPTPGDPAAVQAKVKMGKPVLDRKKCIPWAGQGVCRICFYACPYAGSAVVLVGPQQAPLFEPEKCVGCGLCEEACPKLAHAIRIVPPEVKG
ncbi:MAG: 4Fe-4S dicluster domain-containing protein [Myxococcales bacterium]|nr:4Fe-4S dicluster domain-containing protein [Myxococcales bacterium]